jgi:alpha-L-fucosidase
MNKIKSTCLILIIIFDLMIPTLTFSQDIHPGNFIYIRPGTSPEQIVRIAATVAPSDQQLTWQSMEFTAFAHFGINTFTDKEWGDGTEDPSIFNPSSLDARQWVKVFSDAGMKMVVIVAKHHDGFCYWPSKYTEHSVKKSPWKKGKGDVVGDIVQACHEFGLKVGIYLSPWDRHEKSYGDSPVYNKFFINQLKELLTNYGEITEVWFDGACGEGPNGKKQEYDWSSYYRTIRELQPNALIFGMGPDIRWVGTESGYARETEWSVIPEKLKGTDKLKSKHPIDDVFIPGDLTQDDIGSKEQLQNGQALIWYPAEADVSIRPGWFYHQNQDDQVKTSEQLVDIYLGSVGRNALLLLNVPPDKRGLIADTDIKNLMGMRSLLNQTFDKNLADRALFKYINPLGEKPFYFASNRNLNWRANPETDTCILQLSLPLPKTFDLIMLQEGIQTGQRIEKFRIETWDGTQWKLLTRGTTIGYKRLLRCSPVTTTEVRLIIEGSRSVPTLCTFGLFKLPPALSAEKK